MIVRVGTFNLNNLFSRYNFRGNIENIPSVDSGGITLTFGSDGFQARTFRGRLINEKKAKDTATIAARIRDVMDADVLAVQEVEHIDILKQFNNDYLGGMYRNVALIEGNDSRFIDVGLLSKLPLGPIVSHQAATHEDDLNTRIFSRDLLQVEIRNAAGKKLFNFYNTHLKSHFVPHDEDPVEGAKKANQRRRRQAETIRSIVSRMERRGSRFVLAGDMNDPPDSQHIAAMLEVDGRPLLNTLQDAIETRPSKAETPGQGPGPASTIWTHRFNPRGPETPRYELLDHIWASESLAGSFGDARIDRRSRHGGEGSDHDPAWVDFDI